MDFCFNWCVSRINWHPRFLWQIEALIYLFYPISSLLHSACLRYLDLDMFFHHSSLSSGEDQRCSNCDRRPLWEKSLNCSCFISKQASKFVKATLDKLTFQNLNYDKYTFAMNLMFSCPGSISLIFTIGFLSPLYSFFSSYLFYWYLFSLSPFLLFLRSKSWS